jgi:hypothetical protein
LLKRALAICENALGPEHSDVATALDELAELYLEHGRSTEPQPFGSKRHVIEAALPGACTFDLLARRSNGCDRLICDTGACLLQLHGEWRRRATCASSYPRALVA